MAEKIKCPDCKGKGKIGFMGLSACPRCKGKGYLVKQEPTEGGAPKPLISLEGFFQRVNAGLKTKTPEKMKQAEAWLNTACRDNAKILLEMAAQSSAKNETDWLPNHMMQAMTFSPAVDAYFSLATFYFGRMAQGGGDQDAKRLVHNAGQILFLIAQTPADEAGTLNGMKALAHHMVGIGYSSLGDLSKGEEHLRACVNLPIEGTSQREMGGEAQNLSRDMLKGGLMRTQPCKVSAGGLFSSKICGYGTSYRCPVCGKWVCPTHGLPYTADFWGDHLEGLLCSENCQRILFSWPAILKSYADGKSELRTWGIIYKSRSHIGGTFLLNERNIDDYFASYGSRSNVTIAQVPGLQEFEKRIR